MKTIAQTLDALVPKITEILKVSGAAGASIAVLHQGDTHFRSFGYRDVPNKIAPDENTLYHIASLSKSFTAAALGILVDEKKITWDQPLTDILPTFTHFDGTVRSEATLLDFLSHRTGLATKNALWQQDGPELLLDHADIMPTVSYLEVLKPLRSAWIYNNWNYDIAAEVVESVAGTSYASFLEKNILKPLQLNNTYTSANPPPDNWAHGYMPGPDNELTDVGHPEISDGTVMQGANAVKTSAADLLKYYTAVLEAWRLEADAATGPIELSNPLRCVKDLLSGYIPLDPEAPFDQWYGMGWALADLPAPLGSIGTNGMFLPSMPIVGKGGKKTRVWYHNGSLVGFFSSVHIVPETGTIIVVLTNSITKNDGADWLGQLVLEQLLDNSDKNDYTALAKETAAAYDGMWVQLQHDCNVSVSDSESASELPSRPLSQYTGRYYNKPGNWHIEVKESSDGANLEFAFQSRQTQTHTLQHYKGNTFSWFLTELQSRRLARWPDLDKPTYLFNFVEDRTGDGIDKLVWEHDPDVPGGETFVKAKGEPANKKKDEKGENKGEGSALGHQIEEL